ARSRTQARSASGVLPPHLPGNAVAIGVDRHFRAVCFPRRVARAATDGPSAAVKQPARVSLELISTRARPRALQRLKAPICARPSFASARGTESWQAAVA